MKINLKNPKTHFIAGSIAGLVVGMLVYARVCGFTADLYWTFCAIKFSGIFYAPLGGVLFLYLDKMRNKD
jgi:hypothetical protein